MNILGINYVFHDSSVCVLKEGELVAAVEEERFTRNKHSTEFPYQSISKALDLADLKLEDIDHVTFAFKPSKDISKKLLFILKHPTKLRKNIQLHLLRYLWRYRTINKWYQNAFKGQKKPELHFIPHHQAHIAGSFYASPYNEAALLSMDGSGEWATASLGYGNDQKVEEYKAIYFPYSMGSIYEAITAFCGFKPMYDEGKTMGLAPLGDASVYLEQTRKIIQVSKDGDLLIDFDYFNFDDGQHDYLSQKFIQTFGQPRKPIDDFEDHHLNVAAAFQRRLEEVALEISHFLYEKTQADYLVVAGGVALNSVMNGEIIKHGPFKDIYVMPAAGDNGTAIGAAYCVYNNILDKPRATPHMDPYLGTGYSNAEIEKVLKECKLSYKYCEDVEAQTAQILSDGNIVCWFQGRMEIGPRALGNRSILADPTKAHMKDKINAEVKHREAYRPFAPSVISEATQDYFDIKVNAPFMLKVCDVLEHKKDVLPAITHVDGSARVQTVHKETNPRYHKLISEFGKLSGVPVVLNTSFNVMGEPIVESPYHAIRCFFSTGLDYLVIGNFIIGK